MTDRHREVGQNPNPESRHNRTTARQRFPQMRRGSTMLGSKLSGVTAGVAVLVAIAGLFYVLAKAVPSTLAAPPEGRAATVEFTRDGKLKRPFGYRKWVYVGEVITPNDMNDGEASFP